MRILGLPILEAFKKEHAVSRGPLDAWQTDVEREDWKTPHDIKRRYRSADFLRAPMPQRGDRQADAMALLP